MSLQWESTIFLPEATGGRGTWGSCPGSDSQVAIASSFSAPLRICISNSLGCYRGPWSFSPGLGLWSQPSCLPDLTVQPGTALQKKWNMLSVPLWCHIKPQGDSHTH